MALPTIKVCDTKNDCILANFTNGRLEPAAADNLKFAQYKYTGTKHKHKSKQTLVCESDNLQYIGHNTGPDAHPNTANFRYMVAAYNRRLGKVMLYNSQVYKMHPHFPDDVEDVDDTDLTFRERNDDLTSAFGAVKKRRAMESRRRNQIQGESLEAAMSCAVDNVLSKPEAANITAAAQVMTKASSIIPPYNLEAMDPADVYRLETIISPVAMVALRGPAQVFVDFTREVLTLWTKDQTYASYILDHLAMLPIEPSSRSHKATCLIYLHYMIQLFKMNHHQLRRKNVFDEKVPDVVVKSMLDVFTVDAVGQTRQSSRCMPARLKDKLLTYICALCLILDECSVEYTTLVRDLKIGLKRVEKAFRSLGCFTKSPKLQAGDCAAILGGTATLKVPLTFPEQTLKTRKQKR